ncbi:MAG: ribosomal protein S18-alanine N-acetyltransferase [Myxococcota bacterium]
MIRRATPADAAEIAALEAVAAWHPWSEASVRSTLEARTTLAWLSAGQGYLLATAVAGEGELLTVGVHPDARRQGIASALLGALHDAWREHDVQQGFLEVRATNGGARALYVAHGWEESGLRTGYYADGVDAVLMRWTP